MMRKRRKCFALFARKQREKNPFASGGCINFQHSTLTKHAANNDHKVALQDAQLRGQFTKCMEKNNEKTGSAMKASFNTVYFIVKEEMPLAKFGALVNLQITNGCNDLKNITHQHHSHVTEMVEIISDCIEEKIISILRESPFVGVVLDETSDITVYKKLVILFRAVVNGECQTLFARNASVHNGKADTLVQALLKFLEEKGISIIKVQGLGSDCAPVMLGHLNGVGARLKQLNPFLFQVHCVAHKLALYQASGEAEGVSPADSAKAKGLHSQITRFEFVAITALLHDLLQVISKLSKSFQAQSLDLSMIHPLVEATKSSLNDTQRVPSARRAEFLNLIDEQKLEDNGRVDIQYRDVAIKVTAAGYTAFFQTKERFIEEVVDNIDDRFPADSMTVLDALGILNPKRCPANPAFYGNQELQVLLDHYGKERNGRNGPVPAVIDEQATRFEWGQLRQLMALNYRHLSLKEMSKLLMTEHQDLYPNFARLAAIALVIPVTNADCERAFSTQNRQKTKLLNRLSDATIEHLTCIEANGPSQLDDFAATYVHRRQQACRGR
ncbi:uncharacterized protein C17orf113-like [Porites lutea]|uniref:uncharacterized protein C17orf113-like n=1 Tax=Porites lutea TaxID=51062 RepID=UPI003CC5216A